MTALTIVTLVLLLIGSGLVLWLVWQADRMQARIDAERTD